MSDLTDKFAALEDQLATQDTAMEASLSSILDVLSLINTSVDTLNSNAATNTRAILQALAALDPCACAGTPTLVVPPVITTPITANTELCKRIQAFLHTMQEIMTVLDVASTFSVGLNFTLISNSFNEVIAAIEGGSTVPTISFAEASQLLNDMINYVIGNLLVGDTLSDLFSAQLFDLRDAMSAGTDASSMQSLYNGVIDASGLPSYVKPVFEHSAYNDLYSFYFDPASTPDLTGIDGSVCGLSDCMDISATQNITYNGSGAYAAIVWPSPFTATNNGGFSNWGANVVETGSLAGYTLVPTANVRIYENSGSGTFSDVTATFTFTFGSGNIALVYSPSNEAFTITLCPPV
jgi:hypothetical protein